MTAGLALGLRRSARRASSRARTTSTRTCPRATRSRSTSCPSARAARVAVHRRRRDAAVAAHPHPHGGGRGQERPRRRRRRRLGVDLNRAGVPLLGDRHRAGPPLRRRGGRVPAARCAPSSCASGVSDGNMEEGSLPLRRQRLGDAARAPTKLGTRVRDQEHELVPLPAGRRSSTRSRRQVELVEARRAGRAGDAALRSGPRRDPLDALQGGGARLPLLPRARPAAGAGRAGAGGAGARARCPSCPGPASQRYQQELGLSAVRRGRAGLGRAGGGLVRPRRWPPTAAGPEAAKKVANWLNGEVAQARQRDAAPAPADWKLTPEKLAAVLRLIDAGTIGGPGAKQVVEEVFRTGGDPGRGGRRRRAWRRCRTRAPSRRWWTGCWPRARPRWSATGAGRRTCTGFFVGQVMKELRGKGNPAVVNALLRKKLGGGR